MSVTQVLNSVGSAQMANKGGNLGVSLFNVLGPIRASCL